MERGYRLEVNKMKKIRIILLLLLTLALTGCYHDDYFYDETKLNIVATTSIVGDLVRNIGGDKVVVYDLMGSGIDPHAYNATAGDVRKIQKSDLVVFNGLDLEGKMEKVFSNIDKVGMNYLELGRHISAEKLIKMSSSAVDPHIWFDVSIWMEAAEAINNKLSMLDEENSAYYVANKNIYIVKLEELNQYIKDKVAELPQEQRVLITAHDAFNYFGQAYEFEVIGLQGLSSLDEAGIKKISEIADYITTKKIKAIFIENSVPIKTVQALQSAVKARGFDVSIGGELYSDSLGTKGTIEGTYIGAYKANVNTIVEGLR